MKVTKEKDKEKVPEQPQKPPENYYPYYPYYYPQAPAEGKSNLGLKILVVVIVIFIAAVFIVVALVASMIGDTSSEEEWSQEFDVVIEKDGHYRYTIEHYYYDELEVELKIDLVNGSSYDVYIMDEDQYENSYGEEGTGTGSFAYIYSWEKVNDLDEDFKIDSGYGGPIYLVIDNEHSELTANDADPQGAISVSVDITVITYYEFYLD